MMRGLFGLVGLLVSLVIVGLLVRKQMTVASPAVPVIHAPADVSSGVSEPAAPMVSAPGNPAQQSQQIQQQVKQALEAAMQARPMPDDK